ncbi:Eco57I restriction-modification methylase domain-containing protein [Actinomadura sp. GC306]|uniref:Eco57I restriction-modification methylase domain-containing protein n=1 Tax=Actinomadura sp. GC306 TaxID=2530367 RepID=UPI001A9E7A1F|nr:Eco57I restriction-modification methylase domain-containing protein [Actinomadura sp. GC306]
MVTQALFDVDEPPPPAALQEAVRHGEVFTRRWVVELILDLVGYTADRDLAALRLVEPACGQGAFLGPIVQRLSQSCRAHRRPLSDAAESLRALDLLEGNVELSRALVRERLTADGWEEAQVDSVTRGWVHQGDYLLAAHRAAEADFVVGNPPYIRLEDVPDGRMAAYRSACSTMGGRADVYVGFYEVGLRSLKPGGKLGFICADRWMRNQYGRRLRQMVTQRYSMDLVLVMHDVDTFQDQVSAYPAITVIRNAAQGPAITADTTREFGQDEARALLRWIADPAQNTLVEEGGVKAARLPHWFPGEDSWPTASPARLAVLEKLSERFRPLEDETTGTRVGIGVATGADKVFITEQADLVEEDRMLPLAMARDTTTGHLNWGGSYLVNPWNAAGALVDLADHPRLRAYLTRHKAALRKRHVAVRQPERWYKTIDKVDPRLNTRAKLLLPDMKQVIHPVLDEGGLYPHHNLYFIVSDVWDLRVLGGLLLSNVAEAFVKAYAVRMRGGTLRFQAQYLRKIRVPDPAEIDVQTSKALADAFERRDVRAATQAALRAYGIADLPE